MQINDSINLRFTCHFWLQICSGARLPLYFCRIFIILIKLEMRLRPLKKFSIAKRFSSIFAQSIYTQHYRGKFYLYKVDKRSGGKHYKTILHFKFFDRFLGTNRHAFGFQIYRKIVSAIRICLIYPRTDSM